MLGDLGKLIVAKGFKKLPKVQKIARSGHTALQRKREREIEKYNKKLEGFGAFVADYFYG